MPIESVPGKYNSWSNKATWLVVTWLTNDEALYRYLDYLISVSADENELADLIYEWVQGDRPPSPVTGLYYDLMEYAINAVNFHEIAHLWWAEAERER